MRHSSKKYVPKEVYKQSYRVALSDTDHLRVMYFINYLKFAERAWMEFLNELDFSYTKLIHTYHVFIPTTEINAKILASTKMDDVIEVLIFVEELGRTYVSYRAEIRAVESNKLAADVSIKAVCTDVELTSVRRLPKDFVVKLRSVLEGDVVSQAA